jgi:hypothetical protein
MAAQPNLSAEWKMHEAGKEGMRGPKYIPTNPNAVPLCSFCSNTDNGIHDKTR